MAEAGWIECQLCPKYCRIAPGHGGDCRIRVNIDGKLVATTYARPCSLHLDPIEKKPLFHFLPGTRILSLATVGCNLHCRNCQNWSISQAWPEDVEAHEVPPEALVDLARRRGVPSVAYTYTEPLAYYEYTLACSRAARQAGVANVLVTAGYSNEKPLRDLLPTVDGANVDLKSMDNSFYVDNCGGTLDPVLRTLKLCVEYKVWLEITNLLIPTMNDSPDHVRRLVDWVGENLGPGVPIHFSRFGPRYQLKNLPPTPPDSLERARNLALQAGMRFVYVGNLRSREGENTYCPNPACPSRSTPLVERIGYTIQANRLKRGRCPDCGTEVPGRWR